MSDTSKMRLSSTLLNSQNNKTQTTLLGLYHYYQFVFSLTVFLPIECNQIRIYRRASALSNKRRYLPAVI